MAIAPDRLSRHSGVSLGGDPPILGKSATSGLAGDRRDHRQRRNDERTGGRDLFDQLRGVRTVEEQMGEPVHSGVDDLSGGLDGHRVRQHHFPATVAFANRRFDQFGSEPGQVAAPEKLAVLHQDLEIVGTLRDTGLDKRRHLVRTRGRRPWRIALPQLLRVPARRGEPDGRRTHVSEIIRGGYRAAQRNHLLRHREHVEFGGDSEGQRLAQRLFIGVRVRVDQAGQ
ncbi:hypothetical protein ACWEHA_21495 [Amycolatopsis nivea]